MEEFDHEFDTFEEPAEVKTEEVNVEDEPIVYESQLWLMGIITALIIVNHFSSKWIDLITKLITPAQQEVTNLVNQINALKKELDTISQSEEFAKYSKIERKILKYRQELDSKNKSSSGSMLQAKAAFNTVWLTIMTLSSFFILWNYGLTPLHVFESSSYWYPISWLIAYPSGVSGGVGIPFFSMSMRSLVKNF